MVLEQSFDKKLEHYPLEPYISKPLVIIPAHSKLSTFNMTTSSKKYVLKKLTEKIFKYWKLTIELVLDIEGLLEVVDGTWEEPIDKTSEEWKTWKARDKMARLEILLHIDDKQADIIRRLTTTVALWAKLKELYEPHDGTTKLHTLGALFNMCVL